MTKMKPATTTGFDLCVCVFCVCFSFEAVDCGWCPHGFTVLSVCAINSDLSKIMILLGAMDFGWGPHCFTELTACLLDFGIKCFHAISMWRLKSGSVKRPYIRWWQYISLQTRVMLPEWMALHLWWKRWCACTLRWVDDDLVALCQLEVDVDYIIFAGHVSFVLHEHM